MFAQVIQGHVEDPAQFREAIDQWVREVSPGAIGWLGSTGGVTDDGRLIAIVRFESEDAARRNSDRPEQDQWWAQTSKLFIGEPTFRESSDVTVDQPGDPDRAGFVQVMKGHGTDPDRARELMAQRDPAAWAAFRPDILGTSVVSFDDGDFTMAAYFVSEEAAREGESKEVPAALQAEMEEMGALMMGEMEFFDLRQPMLNSPR